MKRLLVKVPNSILYHTKNHYGNYDSLSGAFLFDENAPDTRGVADKKHSAVIQKKSDTGNIEALDFILEVSRIFDTNDIIAVTVNLDHSVCSST